MNSDDECRTAGEHADKRRRITLPLSFEDDSVVTASEGAIVVQRTVGELVKAFFNEEFFHLRNDASKKAALTKWINSEFNQSKLFITESINNFVHCFKQSATFSSLDAMWWRGARFGKAIRQPSSV
jgi:hypothetical protein